ncbi:MAG TPA: phage gp6-like head-tail connector protein [Flavobacteriaceae bacterium]|nr:phage gp6-like head-tail connector protein [Flavobacteriaceae bacterium]
MKVSEIKVSDIKTYGRIDIDDEDLILTMILASAKQYVMSYTGLTAEAIDEKEDISLAVLAICVEMYEKRQLTTEKESKVNLVIDSILSMYSVNLL